MPAEYAGSAANEVQPVSGDWALRSGGILEHSRPGRVPLRRDTQDEAHQAMNQNQKFALGGGGYVLYAPDYPRYQTSPGFSDPVQDRKSVV